MSTSTMTSTSCRSVFDPSSCRERVLAPLLARHVLINKPLPPQPYGALNQQQDPHDSRIDRRVARYIEAKRLAAAGLSIKFLSPERQLGDEDHAPPAIKDSATGTRVSGASTPPFDKSPFVSCVETSTTKMSISTLRKARRRTSAMLESLSTEIRQAAPEAVLTDTICAPCEKEKSPLSNASPPASPLADKQQKHPCAGEEEDDDKPPSDNLFRRLVLKVRQRRHKWQPTLVDNPHRAHCKGPKCRGKPEERRPPYDYFAGVARCRFAGGVSEALTGCAWRERTGGSFLATTGADWDG